MTWFNDPGGVECAFNPGVRWERVPSVNGLDPSRYIGVRSELPGTARPGDWCTVVLVDALGELQWTFVAVEHDRTTSLFDRRGRASTRAAATAGLDGAPLGGALRRLPQAGRSAPPSG